MNSAQLVANEILRTYNQTDSKPFLKGAITTILNIQSSHYLDSDTMDEIIQTLKNFTADEGLNDCWQNQSKEYYL